MLLSVILICKNIKTEEKMFTSFNAQLLQLKKYFCHRFQSFNHLKLQYNTIVGRPDFSGNLVPLTLLMSTFSEEFEVML